MNTNWSNSSLLLCKQIAQIGIVCSVRKQSYDLAERKEREVEIFLTGLPESWSEMLQDPGSLTKLSKIIFYIDLLILVHILEPDLILI